MDSPVHTASPAPRKPVASRELYAVYLVSPSDRRKVRTRRLHRTLKDALAEAAEKAAAYPGWGVEIARRLHTVTELSRMRVPAQECLGAARPRALERADGSRDSRAVPRRRIAPLFDESA